MNPPARQSRQAFVGVGSNLGDRAGYIAGALHRLRATPDVSYIECSSVRETAPVGRLDQPPFLNAVFGLDTSLTPEALLDLLLVVEQEFGRLRLERWGPRTLDLDLLAFENEVRRTTALELPHPRMFEREFVTVPLREMLRRPHFGRAAWDALRTRLTATG